jgi:DNA repair and recombination protein RAD54B
VLTFPKLRDIFRIHPDTGCHTHDLLECPCEHSTFAESNSDLDSRELSEEREEEEEEEEIQTGFKAASQFKPEFFDKMDKAVRTQKLNCHHGLPVLLSMPGRKRQSLRL